MLIVMVVRTDVCGNVAGPLGHIHNLHAPKLLTPAVDVRIHAVLVLQRIPHIVLSPPHHPLSTNALNSTYLSTRRTYQRRYHLLQSASLIHKPAHKVIAVSIIGGGRKRPVGLGLVQFAVVTIDGLERARIRKTQAVGPIAVHAAVASVPHQVLRVLFSRCDVHQSPEVGYAG